MLWNKVCVEQYLVEIDITQKKIKGNQPQERSEEREKTSRLECLPVLQKMTLLWSE